jgi:hypothetical protein
MINGVDETNELIATFNPSFRAINRNGLITLITLITLIFAKF